MWLFMHSHFHVKFWQMNTQFAMSADFVCCNHVYNFFVVNGLCSLSLNIQFSLNLFIYNVSFFHIFDTIISVFSFKWNYMVHVHATILFAWTFCVIVYVLKPVLYLYIFVFYWFRMKKKIKSFCFWKESMKSQGSVLC